MKNYISVVFLPLFLTTLGCSSKPPEVKASTSLINSNNQSAQKYALLESVSHRTVELGDSLFINDTNWKVTMLYTSALGEQCAKLDAGSNISNKTICLFGKDWRIVPPLSSEGAL